MNLEFPRVSGQESREETRACISITDIIPQGCLSVPHEYFQESALLTCLIYNSTTSKFYGQIVLDFV